MFALLREGQTFETWHYCSDFSTFNWGWGFGTFSTTSMDDFMRQPKPDSNIAESSNTSAAQAIRGPGPDSLGAQVAHIAVRLQNDRSMIKIACTPWFALSFLEPSVITHMIDASAIVSAVHEKSDVTAPGLNVATVLDIIRTVLMSPFLREEVVTGSLGLARALWQAKRVATLRWGSPTPPVAHHLCRLPRQPRRLSRLERTKVLT